MYSTQFLPLLIRHIRVCRFLRSIPTDFDGKSKKLVLITGPFQIAIFRLQLILSLGYCVTLFLGLFLGKMSMSKKAQGLVFYSMHIVILAARWNYSLNNSAMQVINSAMEFETQLLQGKHLFVTL